MFQCSLGDGRRLALRTLRSATLLEQSPPPLTAAELFGAELAGRLANSAPRPLSILYEVDGVLDGVDWAQLGLGTATMTEHFAWAGSSSVTATWPLDGDTEMAGFTATGTYDGDSNVVTARTALERTEANRATLGCQRLVALPARLEASLWFSSSNDGRPAVHAGGRQSLWKSRDRRRPRR